MKWDEDALKLAADVPVPPMMAFLVKHDAERRAIQSGLDCVSVEIVKKTAQGYEQTFGREASRMVQAMLSGGAVDLPEEFFEDDGDELYKIDICPAKYGACTAEKREMIRNLLNLLRLKLKELDLTRIVKLAARSPLMSHHVFRFSIIGCPNCCLSPYFSDVGIIALYRPEITGEICVKCGLCLEPCIEKAIDLSSDVPVIDGNKCVCCGSCAAACQKGVIQTAVKGYKVVMGGTGARHPQIARTVSEFTDIQGVLSIIEKGVSLFRDSTVDTELSFHEIIKAANLKLFAQ